MNRIDNFPELPRPFEKLVRLVLAILKFLVIRPLQVLFFLMCLVSTFWVRRDINAYKVNSIFSLVFNLVAKLLKFVH